MFSTSYFIYGKREAKEVVLGEGLPIYDGINLPVSLIRDTVSLSVSERSFKKRDPSLWTSPEKFVVLGDQT